MYRDFGLLTTVQLINPMGGEAFKEG